MTFLPLYLIALLYGIIIGSFLNVCILRIPAKENITTTRSHCMNCGYQLKWYDLIPLFSYLFLRGRCRKCKQKISPQYPIIESLNGIFYVWIFVTLEFSLTSIILCFFTSALLVLSVIDFRTYEIPESIIRFIGILGIARVILDWHHIIDYFIGFISVAGFLYLLYILTNKRGIGGGDIKLMAVAGLILGYKLVILAFILGCILGSIIHLIRMKVSNEDKLLAFGPYLSMGIFIAICYGNPMIDWYLALFV